MELDLGFRQEAEDFLAFLTDDVWRTPRSQSLLAAHHQPQILDLVAGATIGPGRDVTGALAPARARWSVSRYRRVIGRS